jgi:hypothetical protein
MGDIGKVRRERILIPESEPGRIAEPVPEPAPEPEPVKVPA